MAEKDEVKEEGEKTEPKKKGFPVMLIVLAVVLLLLAGGGFFVWNSFFSHKSSKGNVPAQATGEKAPGAEIGPVFPLETFIVNLSDPHGKRYLKVKVDLELNNEGVKPEIEKRLSQLKDMILTVLSSKGYEDIRPMEGKLQLRAEIMSTLNHYLKTGSITNIYFTEFVVQ